MKKNNTTQFAIKTATVRYCFMAVFDKQRVVGKPVLNESEKLSHVKTTEKTTRDYGWEDGNNWAFVAVLVTQEAAAHSSPDRREHSSSRALLSLQQGKGQWVQQPPRKMQRDFKVVKEPRAQQ